MSRVIITMAGLGTRFKAEGYTVPKYKVEVGGRSLFHWSLSALDQFIAQGWKFTFVSLKSDDAGSFVAKECEALGIQQYDHIELNEQTSGQATTALMALHPNEPQEQLVIFNIDTGVKPGTINPDMLKGDGWLACFAAEGDHWSFANIDQHGRVSEVAEKIRISDAASIGFYAFKSQALFAHAYAATYNSDEPWPTHEAYIAPMYQTLIDEGCAIFADMVPAETVFCLGTPEQVDAFVNQNANSPFPKTGTEG